MSIARRLAIVLCLTALSGLGLAAGAAARAPQVLQGSYVANYFLVKPGLMSFYSPVAQTFTEYITGPHVSRSQYRHGHDGAIHWVRYNDRFALAYGEQWEDDCSPSCDGGLFVPMPVRLLAWRVRHGRYTRLAEAILPRGLEPLVFVYSLLLSRHRFDHVRIYYWGTATTVADLGNRFAVGARRAGAVG